MRTKNEKKWRWGGGGGGEEKTKKSRRRRCLRGVGRGDVNNL